MDFAGIRRSATWAGLLYAAATGLDLTTTTFALDLGLREGNPVIAPFISAFGLLPQVGISLLLCAVLWWYATRGGTKLVLVLAGIRWLVVLNNALQLAQANHFLAVWR